MFGPPPRQAAAADSARRSPPAVRSGPAWAFLRDATAAAGPPHRPYASRNDDEPERASRRNCRCRLGRTAADGPVGEAPGLAAVGRSGERPRLAGPETPGEGDPSWKEPTRTAAPPVIASGEKAKARDIIAAIRTLQADRAGAPPGHRRRAADPRPLRRLRGRGPVALSRPGHRPLQGRRLAGPRRRAEIPADARGIRLVPSAPPSTPSTPRPSSSRPCTGDLARLGVPGNATVLEPGCGTGNFMSQAAGGHAVHRRRAGCASPAASPAPCTRTPTSASRISATPSCPRAASTP